MSLHNRREWRTPDLDEALRRHGLEVDTPSQLSDSFRLGWRAREDAAYEWVRQQSSEGIKQ